MTTDDYLFYTDEQVTLFSGDSLAVARHLDDGAADCIVTSPPYLGLRDYGIDGQYGLEASPAEYVETMRALFSELRRVLADDGTLWLNIGDSYSDWNSGFKPNAPSNVKRRAAGDKTFNAQAKITTERRKVGYKMPPKNLLGIPWRVAFALQDDGWILRNAIVWNKPNAMPESVTDRLSKRYEMVFMLSKKPRYWFDLDPIREPAQTKAHPIGKKASDAAVAMGHKHHGLIDGTFNDYQAVGRNPGDVWNINTQPFSAAHFAVMPRELAQRCILAGCKPGGTVLDPFSGSGTTGLAAQQLGRKYIGIDLNPDYLKLSLDTRFANATLDFGEEA
jgi:DNA modification methylase